MKKLAAKPWTWTFVAMLFLGLSGCQGGNGLFLPDSGFNDGTTGWTENLRTPTGSPATGVSGRARDIERNLGMPVN